MLKKAVLTIYILISLTLITCGQVKVRIFADQQPSSAVFTVSQGRFELDVYDGLPLELREGDPVIFANFRNKIAVKIKDEKSFMCDSLIVRGLANENVFTLRLNGNDRNKRVYSGDLMCSSDLGIMVFINICDIEKYIAGVVRTEGGSGRNVEYLKSQAVLARTFLYKHFNRHSIDRYNMCDGTHCQAFNGITSDQPINRAAIETKGLIAMDPDSNLIISAFHSNCGGETTTADDVWLSAHSHVKRVIDPYCLHSPNATWKKTIPLAEWKAYLVKAGFNTKQNGEISYNFTQLTRQSNYTIGSFSMPFSRIRSDMNLKSTFFSVRQEGNSILLNGRGYGHGVGLCQEGAMVMSSRGFKFNEIIGFYYPEIIITDIRYAKIVENDF